MVSAAKYQGESGMGREGERAKATPSNGQT